MTIIALDLSTVRTGVCIFSETGDIIKRFSISTDEKLSNFHKIKFIVDQLHPYFREVDDIIIEDIFLNTFATGAQNVTGYCLLARLSGAVINAWLNMHDNVPVLFKATEARKLAGIKGTCQKAEVQVFICEKFKIATEEQIDVFKSMIEAEAGSLAEEEFTKATWKKHMQQISTYIDGETELGEDESDAILLSVAYVNGKKEGKI
jgi:hypothetical protein